MINDVFNETIWSLYWMLIYWYDQNTRFKDTINGKIHILDKVWGIV